MGEPNRNSLAWIDHEREEGTLTRVDGPRDGWYSVTSSNGWGCGVSAEYGVEPKVGDAFVTWGTFGRPIRGQAINRHVLYYRTPAQQDVQQQIEADARKAEKIAEYESKRSDYDRRVAALPPLLRSRIEGFRARGGDEWRWDHEPYEMACCEEAGRLVQHFQTADAIAAFAKLDWKEQEAAFPQMDKGHSGNTWGFSVMLAKLVLTKPQHVVEMHAAICPLVGCADAHCWSTTQRAAPAAEDRAHD